MIDEKVLVAPDKTSPIISEQQAIKKVIHDFLQDRQQTKLDKEKKKAEDPEERQKIIDTFVPEQWIASAAKRVSGLQLVTHALKYIHSAAKGGTEIYDQAPPNPDNETSFLSTRTLRDKALYSDVVGNAACLDVYKFLQLSSNGETLLSRVMKDDPDLFEAFPGTVKQKQEWLTSFKNIALSQDDPATHELAKQLYYPINAIKSTPTKKDHYHLIAPLYPTSLVHVLYEKIQMRFSEETKAAKKAKRDEKPHPHGYREYYNLAVQEFGGSKPQNISQLNSSRGGKSYLLPSLPPTWRSQELTPPLKMSSIFKRRFAYRVSRLTKELSDFLIHETRKNMTIRIKRERLVNLICDELLCLASQYQETLTPGWSSDSACQLPEAQCFWLDPYRANEDKAWGEKLASTNWRDSVCRDFAIWLNSVFKAKGLHMGDEPYHEWNKVLKREFALLKEVL